MKEEESILIFQGKLQVDDLKKMNIYRFHMRKKGYTLFLLTFFSLFFLYARYRMRFSLATTLLIMLGGIVIGCMVGFLFLNKRLAKEYALDPAANGLFIYTVTESGIHMKSEHISQFMVWSGFGSLFEYSDMFILSVTTIKVVPIPKRFFNSQEEIDTFRNIAHKKIIGKE